MATFNREHFKRIAAMLQAIKPREVGGWNGEKLFASGRRKQWEETVDYTCPMSLNSRNLSLSRISLKRVATDNF